MGWGEGSRGKVKEEGGEDRLGEDEYEAADDVEKQETEAR